jgi:uncharacterized tellurite resistance protein B-like protein
MTPRENLYYAMGEVAYAVAMADGRIQNDEMKKLHTILESELTPLAEGVDIAEIIFQVLKKDLTDGETAYASAMHQMKLHSQYLSPDMKLNFLHVAEKVAKAFPPTLRAEKKLIARFRHDISEIHGDPVFYGQ